MDTTPHPISRRRFLAGTAAALALSGCADPQARLDNGPSASRPDAGDRSAKARFEVGISVYAWDLHDEGMERVLDNLQMAAVNNIYVLGLMQSGKSGPRRRPSSSAQIRAPTGSARRGWRRIRACIGIPI